MRLSRLTVRTLPLAASILLLASCATLSKEQCAIGDWQAIGYSDGVAGYYADRLSLHAKACAKAGVAPDYQAWERGRQQGLKQYCSADNAFALGRRGQALNSVCPAEVSHRLQNINAQGREYYALSNQLREARNQLKQYQTEYIKLRDGEMLNFKSEKEARARLLSLPARIRRLRQQIADTEAQLESLERLSPY